MSEYYANKLSGTQLKQVYDLAPPRIKQYLDAEVNHVLETIHRGDLVLELGCGYGRILTGLARKAGWVIGIDTSTRSLGSARELLRAVPNCLLLRMDARTLAFRGRVFYCVVCIQNGISAFHVDQRTLVNECVRVVRPGGKVLFSTYADRFWKERLEWFALQSEAGLLGEIDYERTGNGVIVCKDGFTATIVSADQFQSLTADLNVNVRMVEVDNSSLFCEIVRDAHDTS